jgi:hypothetical protein
MRTDWLTVALVEEIHRAVLRCRDMTGVVSALKGATVPGLLEYGCLRRARRDGTIPPLPFSSNLDECLDLFIEQPLQSSLVQSPALRLSTVFPHELSLGQDVSLHGVHQLGFGCSGRQVHGPIQGVELEEVVVRLAPGRGGTAVADVDEVVLPLLPPLPRVSVVGTPSSSSRVWAGRLKRTQWTQVPRGASGSSQIRARLLVPEGGSDQPNGGDPSCRAAGGR